jgi:hypothetical protein
MTALPSLATPQAALDQSSVMTHPRTVVYVDGVMVPHIAYSGQHDVGRTATGRLTLLLPRPGVVAANATVEVQGGHNDLVGTLFSGYVPNWESAMVAQGNLLDVHLVGWSALLQEPLRRDLVFQGPIALDAVFVAVCQACGVPSYIAEATTYADNVTPVMLGGNSRIDDGRFVIQKNRPPLVQLAREAEKYRYFISDAPMGPVLLHRVGGTPAGDPVVVFREGVHLGDTRRPYDTREIVNVWDVRGATYEDEYGGRVPIRSIADPDTVPPHDEIRGGYRYREVTYSDVVRQDQADAVRNWLEIEYSAATAPVTWDATALPGLAPGDCVEVASPTVKANGRYWLMGLDLNDGTGGFTGTYTGSAGAGEEYPGIVDRVTVAVQTGPIHLGNETLTHYAVDAPSGTSTTWTITIPANASTVNIRGWHHGTNSQITGGVESELQVTRWQVWDPAVPASQYDSKGSDAPRPEASGTMPSVPEELARRRNYSTFTVAGDGTVTDPGFWTPFAINLGRIEPGTWTLRLVSGDKEGPDDFEVRLVLLELYGTVEAAGYTEGES